MLRNVRDIRHTVCTPKIPISRHQSRGIIMCNNRFNFSRNSKFKPIRRSSNWVNDKFPTCSDFFRSCVACAKNFSACLICCFTTLECFLFRLAAGTFNRPDVESVSTPRAVSSLSKLSSTSSCVVPSSIELKNLMEKLKMKTKQIIKRMQLQLKSKHKWKKSFEKLCCIFQIHSLTAGLFVVVAICLAIKAAIACDVIRFACTFVIRFGIKIRIGCIIIGCGGRIR